jgi:farnesyl diphosphate synthase
MHRCKTGALLQASVMMGATAAGASDRNCAPCATYGSRLGLAFQVVDDILDVTADTATLGKTAGKDAAADKPTFVSLMGFGRRPGLRRRAAGHRRTMRWIAAACPTPPLHALADWVAERSH